MIPSSFHFNPEPKAFSTPFSAPGADKSSESGRNEAVQPEKGINSIPVATHFDADEVVNNLVNFVRARVAMAAPEDQEAMLAQARKGIETGFGQAADMLKSMGRLNESFQDGMQKAEDVLADALKDVDSLMAYQPEKASAPEADKTVRAGELYYRNTEDLSLSLTTREGDRIEIRYRTDTEKSAGFAESSNSRLFSWMQSDSSQFDLVIKGDLNDKEQKALDSLLADVDSLANEFYDGDIEKAFNMASALEMDMTQFSKLNLRMTETEVTGVAAYQQAAGGAESLPKGLSPLAEYARHLVDSMKSLENDAVFRPRDLLDLMDIHPLNQPAHSRIAGLLSGVTAENR